MRTDRTPLTFFFAVPTSLGASGAVVSIRKFAEALTSLSVAVSHRV